jgi:hypothetical protein
MGAATGCCCLPDAIEWAVGAGGLWKQLVEPVVDEIIELG